MSITDKDVQLEVVLLIPTIKKRNKFQSNFQNYFLIFLKEILIIHLQIVSEYYSALV